MGCNFATRATEAENLRARRPDLVAQNFDIDLEGQFVAFATAPVSVDFQARVVGPGPPGFSSFCDTEGPEHRNASFLMAIGVKISAPKMQTPLGPCRARSLREAVFWRSARRFPSI